MQHLFFFAGEPSGDLHGSALMRKLKNKLPHLKLVGVGGPLMRKEGISGRLKMEYFQVMGFSDVLKALLRLGKYFYQIVKEIIDTQPDAVVLIDYPGFNLRLAKALRKRNYKGKIIQYICPSVWAHGKNRIKTLAANHDLLLTIYPFEKEYFNTTPLKVEYIGNPLVQNINKWKYNSKWRDHLNISSEDEFIALFPGSRSSEIARHFPLFLKCAENIKKSHPFLKFVCCYVNADQLKTMQKSLEQSSLKMNQNFFFISSNLRYEIMQDCEIALAKSGTVTLELALLQTPTVVVYELSYLNHFLAKYFLRLNLPYYCIVNILAKIEVFPELMGSNLSHRLISDKLQTLYENVEQRKKISLECQTILNDFGDKHTHQAAAEAIMGLWK